MINIQSRINQIEKRVSKKTSKHDYRSVLFLTKENDDKMYDFWAWKERGMFVEIDTEKYKAMGGLTVYINSAYVDPSGKGYHGFIPPGIKRENLG